MPKYNKRILAIKDPLARAWFKYIWRQVHINRFGYFGVNTGTPGHGKTETALLQSWFQDTTFTIDRLKEKITMTPKDFLKRLSEFDKHEWLVMSDTGLSTSISSKNWNKLVNILIEDTTQIMRIKRMGVVFDAQVITFIDNRVRSLFHYFTEIRRHELNPPKWKIHEISMNQMKGTLYFPHPVLKIDGRLVKLRNITLDGRIPKEFRREFEEIQEEFKDTLLKKHVKSMVKIDMEENPMDIWEMIEHVKNNQDGKFLNSKGKLDDDMIQLGLGVGRSKSAQIKKFIIKNEIKTK